MLNELTKISVSEFDLKEEDIKKYSEEKKVPHPDEFNLPTISGIHPPTNEGGLFEECKGLLERFDSFEDCFSLTDEDLELTEDDLKYDIFLGTSTPVEDIFQKVFQEEFDKQRRIKAIRSLLKETEEAFVRWTNSNQLMPIECVVKEGSYPFHVTTGWYSIGADIFEIDKETYLFKIVKENRFDNTVKELFVSSLEISDEFIQQKISEYCIRHLFKF